MVAQNEPVVFEQKVKDEDIPSLMEIKKVLPEHVFRPSAKRSLSFVARDLAIVSCLLLFAIKVCPLVPVLYIPYWLMQGTMFWAIFVLGHDCGHSSFSLNSTLNDVVGTILHTAILVPFYSWKLSHRAHHKNTGNMDKDEIFYPVRESEAPSENVPFFEHTFFLLGLSWFYYLVIGYKPRTACHFDPNDPLFAGKQQSIRITIAAYVAWCLALAGMCVTLGFGFILKIYFLPILVFATWLVAVTFLHHNDNEVEWYSNDNWNYVKGNLSSVDRDYGLLHNLTHNIGTHQIHHLFPVIPHYYLEEATAAFRKAYPHLVKISNEPIIPAYIRQFRVFASQHIIPDATKIFWYTDLTPKKAN